MAIDGFTASRVATNGIELSVHRGGTGAPLILLHGFPELNIEIVLFFRKAAFRREHSDDDSENGTCKHPY